MVLKKDYLGFDFYRVLVSVSIYYGQSLREGEKMIFERVYIWVIRFSLAVSVVLYGFGIFFYSRLPVEVPTQIGFDGGVNSWGSKWTVFLFPTLLLGIALISRSNYIDIRYPNNRENRLYKLVLCSCLLLLAFGSVYFFFLYRRLLE